MAVIAIDGPAGAGKTTIAKRLAEQLDYLYVDTGALYRAIGYFALTRGLDVRDESAIAGLLVSTSIDLRFVNMKQCVFLNNQDITEKIRTEAVSMAASAVSALPIVRQFLMKSQRDLAKHGNVILNGRDIGTVVCPDADIKIFLTASSEERASRRFLELRERGVAANYEDVLADIIKRDEDDSSRSICPLTPADDAIIVDTTGNELDKSVKILTELVKNRLAEPER